jgi:hypothetical protein
MLSPETPDAVLQNMGRTPDQDSSKAHDAPADSRPGRVEVDARGRNVWRWNKQEGDSTSVLLQRLDNKDLALEPTQKVPVMKKAASAGAALPAAASPTRASAKAPAVASRAAPKTVASRNKAGVAKTAQKPSNPFGRERDKGDKGGGFDPYNSR